MNVTELRRFLGMANQLAKLTPNIADITKPLCNLLSKTNVWICGHSQQQAFDKVKEVLSTAPTLYDPQLPIFVSADASAYGLGAVLVQQQPDGSCRSVVYASRALTPTEQRYVQIERKC